MDRTIPPSVELLQGLEVEVPEALVSLPGIVIATCDEAKGLRHIGVKDVEAIASSLHLGEESVLRCLKHSYHCQALSSQYATRQSGCATSA